MKVLAMLVARISASVIRENDATKSISPDYAGANPGYTLRFAGGDTRGHKSGAHPTFIAQVQTWNNFVSLLRADVNEHF